MSVKKQVLTAHDAVPEPVPPRGGDVAESGENYLETIFVIKERNEDGIVRAVDVANELGFSKPSVSRGLGLLRDKGFIKIAESGTISFTPEGRARALQVFERHQLLTVFLQHIAKVPADIAERDACRIEHVVSQTTMQGIKNYLKENNLID